MRAHRITEWTLEPPYARRLRQLNRTPGGTYETCKKGIEDRDPAICVNVIVGLIKVTCYLLDLLLRRLGEDFLREGGPRAHGSCSARRSRQTAATPMTSPCHPFCPSGR